MGRPRWTEQERARALGLYLEHGAAEASRRCGIPVGTIASWVSRGNNVQPRLDQLDRRAEVSTATAAELRAGLALDSYRAAGRLLRQLFEPAELVKIMALRQGPQTVGEAVRARLDEPTAGEKRHLAIAAAVLMDKGQLLSGEATARFGKAELDLERELEAFAMGADAAQQPAVPEGLPEPQEVG